MNYDNIRGVQYRRYENESDQDEPNIDKEGRLDEMYVEDGQLYVGFEGPEAFHSLHIPLERGSKWRDFVQSLVGTLQ